MARETARNQPKSVSSATVFRAGLGTFRGGCCGVISVGKPPLGAWARQNTGFGRYVTGNQQPIALYCPFVSEGFHGVDLPRSRRKRTGLFTSGKRLCPFLFRELNRRQVVAFELDGDE